MEQEVCQLLLAALCWKTDGKWQKLAIQGGNNQKTHQALKKPAYETRVSFMSWLFSQQNFVVLCF
jgi:hypothetical protein